MTVSRIDVPEGLDGHVWWLEPVVGVRRESHRHREPEFNLVMAGAATYLFNDRRVRLTPGSLIWLMPGEAHVLVEESRSFRMWIAVFRPRMVKRVCATAWSEPLTGRRLPDQVAAVLNESRLAALDALMRDMRDYDDQPDRYNAALAHLLLSAWSAFHDAEGPGASAGLHPAVHRAARLLRDEVEPLGLEQIAERAGLSPSRLSRLFKQQTGVSIVAYRQRQCLSRFLALYGRGQRLNITEAALRAGFGSYSHFHRVFTEHFGYGPAEHRRRVRQAAGSKDILPP